MCVQIKQEAAFFLVYLANFVIQKPVFKSSAGSFFLVYSVNFVIRKHVLKSSWRLLSLVYSVYFVIRKDVCTKQAGRCFCNTKNVCPK